MTAQRHLLTYLLLSPDMERRKNGLNLKPVNILGKADSDIKI